MHICCIYIFYFILYFVYLYTSISFIPVFYILFYILFFILVFSLLVLLLLRQISPWGLIKYISIYLFLPLCLSAGDWTWARENGFRADGQTQRGASSPDDGDVLGAEGEHGDRPPGWAAAGSGIWPSTVCTRHNTSSAIVAVSLFLSQDARFVRSWKSHGILKWSFPGLEKSWKKLKS